MKQHHLSLFFLISFHQGSVESYVREENLFPFGLPASDEQLPSGDRSFAKVPLPFPLPFFNTSYNHLYISENGAIFFHSGAAVSIEYAYTCSSMEWPSITPFLADVDTNSGGAVFYRQSTNFQLLKKASAEIGRHFPEIYKINFAWMFISTWFNTSSFGSVECRQIDKHNTFQSIIVSDGQFTFAIFYYHQITWTAGTFFGSGNYCNDQNLTNGSFARSGFDVGGYKMFYEIPGSCTPGIVNITKTSNIGEPGKWIFRIDSSLLVPDPCQRLESRKLKIRPTFVSFLRNESIELVAPRLDIRQDSSVHCQFFSDESSEMGNSSSSATRGYIGTVAALPSTKGVTCQVPRLYSQGRVTVKLLVSNTARILDEFSGYVYTKTPEYMSVSWKEHNGSWNYQLDWRREYFDAQINRGKRSHCNRPSWQQGEYGCIYVGGKGTSIAQASNVRMFKLKLAVVESIFENSTWFEIEKPIAEELPNADQFSGPFDFQLLKDRSATSKFMFRLIHADTNGTHPQKAMFSEFQTAPPNPVSFLSPSAARDRCDAWYESDTGPPRDLLPCPPLLQQASMDGNFVEYATPSEFQHIVNASYRQSLPSPSGGEQKCVYTRDGKLFTGIAGGGTANKFSPSLAIYRHWQEDLSPWTYCCKSSGSQAYCKKYVERRPIDSGTKYSPPKCAWCWGDPHFRTFDGLSYDFMGVGEFWMIENPDISVHGRMERSGTVSILTALVMRQHARGNSELTVQVSRGSNAIDLRLDGEAIDLTSIEYPQSMLLHPEGVLISIKSAYQISVQFSAGFTFDIDCSSAAMSVNICANQRQFGKIKGLFGNYDGNVTNEFEGRDGSIVPTTLTYGPKVHAFGQTWKVKYSADGARTRRDTKKNQDGSLFTYPENMSADDYNQVDPTYTPNFLDPATVVDPVILEFCGNSTQCIFDYAVTGNATMAQSTLRSVEKIAELVKVGELKTEMCGDVMAPKHSYYVTDSFFVGSTMSFGCKEGFAMENPNGIRNPIPSLTCAQETGVFKWSGDLNFVCTAIRRTAQDDVGATTNQNQGSRQATAGDGLNFAMILIIVSLSVSVGL